MMWNHRFCTSKFGIFGHGASQNQKKVRIRCFWQLLADILADVAKKYAKLTHFWQTFVEKKEYLDLENLFFYTNVCQKWVSFVYFLATSAKMSAKSCQKQRILAFFGFGWLHAQKSEIYYNVYQKTHNFTFL